MKTPSKPELVAENAHLREVLDAVQAVIGSMQADVLEHHKLVAHTGYLAKVLNVPARMHSNGAKWFVEHRGVTVQFPYAQYDDAIAYLRLVTA